MLKVLLISIVLSPGCLTFKYIHNGVELKFRPWDDGKQTTVKVDENWSAVRSVLDKMAAHLEAPSILPYLTKDNHFGIENVEFRNVVVVNWLADVAVQPLTAFDLEEDTSNAFAMNEKVIIVNYTIPQLLFTAEYNFQSTEQGGHGTVHCALDKMAVGMFMHFATTTTSDKLIYVDNFQMLPPEKSFVLVTNDTPVVSPNIDNINDKVDSEWKLAVWLTTYELIEDYLRSFMLTNDEMKK